MFKAATFISGMISGACLLATGLILGGAAVRSALVPAVIQARSFEVVDDDGNVLLLLGANEHGGSISTKHRDGATMAVIAAAEGGGRIVVLDDERRPVAVTDVRGKAPDGGGRLQLFNYNGNRVFSAGAVTAGGAVHVGDARGRSSLMLGVDSEGMGMVQTFASGEERPLVRLFSTVNGSGIVETYNQHGRRLTALSSTVGDHGQIGTYDGRGNTMVLLTSTAEREGHIYTFDGEDRPLAAIGSHEYGPTFRLFNRSGDPVIALETDEDGAGEISVTNHRGSGRTIRAD